MMGQSWHCSCLWKQCSQKVNKFLDYLKKSMGTHCCGCLHRRTASLIIGYLSAVGYFGGSVYLLFMTALSGLLMNKGLFVYFTDLGQRYFTYYSTISALVGAGFILSILLLVGLHKNKRKLIDPYLLYAATVSTMALGYLIKYLCDNGGFHHLTDYCYVLAIFGSKYSIWTLGLLRLSMDD